MMIGFRKGKDFTMASKPLFAALALTAGIAALAAPTLLSADDRGGRWGGMMGFGMMDGAGDGPMAGFDFAKVDANGDGKITSEELAAWRQAGVAGIDADGDHLISAEELTAKMMAEAQARIEARAKDRVAAQDANGDGKLSVEELIAPRIGTRLFERADADGDGAVSEAEFQAMHERMGAMQGQRGGMMGQRGPGMDGCGMGGGMPGRGMMGGQMHGHGGWFGGGGGWDDGMMPGNGACQ
jgi:hypothetical protein